MRRFENVIGGRRRVSLSLLLVGAIAVGGFAVNGAASSSSGQATVVYVVARSGSMGAPGGACGSRLACVKAAITDANAALDSSSVAWTGLALANPSGAARDVNFGARGTQLFVRPEHDGNGNGRADLADAAHRVSLGGATCYSCGVDAARTIASSAPGQSTRNVIVFIADRPNQVGPALSSLAGTLDSNTVIRAVAIGPRTTCGAQQLKVGRGGRTEVWVGSLAPVANLTPGGSCVHVSALGAAGAVSAAAG